MALNDEEREDLVAYLDGELDEEKSRQMEARLNLDPEARAEAEALQQTWGLLDYLPRPEPSASFTHRTLERLSVQSTQIGRGRGPWVGRVGWAAVILCSLLGGLVLSHLLWAPHGPATPQDALLRHLRVIDNLPRYEPVDDLGFLKELDHPDLFGDDTGF